MIAPVLARGQLARPTVQVVAAGAALVGAWSAWSPGTEFGLSGLLGGWQFAGPHLLDAGLVLMALVGALTGAGVRERRVDEQLHGSGVERWSVLRSTAGAGGLVALGVAVAFAAGTGAGGLLRSVTRGGSTWIDANHAPTVVIAASTFARMGVVAALVGAMAALIGWVSGREDLGAAVVVVLALPYLEQSSALFGRVPPLADALAFGPWGALRAVALADRGLAASGHEHPTAVLPFAVVALAWFALFVALARPPGRGRPATAPTGSVPVDRSSVLRPAAAGLVVVVVLTVVAGATVPTRLADALPWRWQRPWRTSQHEGWSSSQSVDQVVADIRAGVDPGARLTRSDAVSAAVVDSLRRASRVERQPESTIRGPDQVVVRLRFDQPVRSGVVEFTDYLVRFTCVVDELGHWRVAGSEGPVASATTEGATR